MKNIYLILALLITILAPIGVFAQAPNKMTYQSVVRNTANNLVINTPISIRIGILQGSPTGTLVLSETHNITTNSNGLATFEIGNGTNISGSIQNINWGLGPFYLQLEVDITGGTNYSLIHTAQFLSVPYALYALRSMYTDSTFSINSITDNGDGTLTFDYSNGNSFTTSDLTGPTGLTGPAGPQGPQGPQGLQGPAGPVTNGALVRTTSEPVGANCSTGGIRIDFGQDANNNNVLDSAEVNLIYTKYVCNGSQGPQGIQGPVGPQGIVGPAGPVTNGALIRTSVEAPGSNCTTGGFRMEFGQDTNGNNNLDSTEVNPIFTRFVCNGSQGPQGIQGIQGPVGPAGPVTNGALIRSSVETPGTNCSTGGIRMEFGQDANGNNILEPGEVNNTLTQFVCNGSQGPIGPAGPTGPAGATGPIGSTGKNSLIKTTTEPAGANCTNGGVKVEVGTDQNSNGILDATEINLSLTKYVCNGGNSTSSWYLGQDTLGGIVFHLYQGSDGLAHGLIVSKTQTTASWQNPTSLVNANRSWDGSFNTGLITNSLAKTWVQSLGAGWYIPSIDELNLLLTNRFHVNNTLNAQAAVLIPSSGLLWSSTEVSATNAYRINLLTSAFASTAKGTSSFVRGVRAF